MVTSQLSAQNVKIELPIKTIELVHHTHTDIGYTDNPVIVMDLQKRYFDMALDAMIATIDSDADKKFYWTAEAIAPIYDWWNEASPDRKNQLLSVIKSKQLSINALPFHIEPFNNFRQNKVMTNWIPDELWKQFNPKFGMMNDVNGFPRSLAINLLDKGINHIWLSINNEWGGSPFKQPNAFWWKMPDGRKTLVWLNTPYWAGYEIFNARTWVHGWEQAYNTQFRTPRAGDILKDDDESVREAHRICVENLKKKVDEGYNYDFIAYSITNQWRIDNDGPYPELVKFIKKWNDLGLKPSIHLTTVADALDLIEKKLGTKIKTYEGEFTDWWSFGGASAPREMAAARMANVYINAITAPVWGKVDSAINKNIYSFDKDLCLFSEHTFASNQATLDPFGFFNQGHIAEKNILAYRPYERAKWMLAQLTRNKITKEKEGLYVINTGETTYSGWVKAIITSFRGEKYKSVINPDNKKIPLIFEGNNAKFWVEQLPSSKISRFSYSTDSLETIIPKSRPTIKTDSTNWPISSQWAGMDKPLFDGDIAEFYTLQSTVGRDLQAKVWNETDPLLRSKKLKESTKESLAFALEKATVKKTAYSTTYEQKISHPRLSWATRKIEIWNNEPRAQITFKMDRLSSANPEIFYLSFVLPKTDSYPEVSTGGINFLPYKGQIPGTCTDQFAIDGWVHYSSKEGSWIWSSRDVAIISFDGQQFAEKSLDPPANMNKISAMVYNNLWHLNYQDNYPGEMEFQFDLVWNKRITDNALVPKIVQTYNLPPLIMINPATRENEIIFKRMNEIK